MKKIEEIRARYDLTGKRQIAIFVVLWVLIVLGLGISVLELALRSDTLAGLLIGIMTALLYVFFLIYAMFGGFFMMYAFFHERKGQKKPTPLTS